MATRSLIRIFVTYSYAYKNKTSRKTEKIELYKHWDGYPEVTVPLIVAFLQESKFGFDTHLNSVSQVTHAFILYAASHGIRVQPLGIDAETNELTSIYGIEYEYNIKIDSDNGTAILDVIDSKKKKVIDTVKLKISKRGNENFELVEWAGLKRLFRK